MHHERLAKSDHTFLRARYRALEHKEVIFDDTVVREATQGRDLLFGNVCIRRCIRLIRTRADTIDFLVQFRAMVIAV